MKNTPLIPALLIGSLVQLSTASAATFPYENEFTSSGDAFSVESTGNWTVDTINEVYTFDRNNQGDGSFYALDQVTGTSGNDFTVSSTFTVTHDEIVSGSGNSIRELRMFSLSNSTSGGGINAVYRISSFLGGSNTIRLEGAGFNNLNASLSAFSFALDTEYEFTLQGDYTDSGDLDLTFTMSDGTNSQQLIATWDAETAPLPGGDYFGWGSRLRADGHTRRLAVDYENFSVVPEPSAYALLAGMLGLSRIMLRRRRRGIR